MLFIRHKNLFFILPAILIVLSIISVSLWHLRPGIDLVGGSLLHITYMEGERPSVETIHQAVAPLNLGEVRVQPTQQKDYLLRQKELTTKEKGELMKALTTTGKVMEVEFNSIGPSIGAELMKKAWWAMGLVSLAIISFIAFAFRKVSKPVASWKYGIVAIITLVHDIILPLGVFAFMGYERGAEVDALFIVALLTILGISINDTIVVFDRIRGNLKLNQDTGTRQPFGDVVGKSITQTLARSINTSLTVTIVLVALFVLGPESTKNFALTLIIGMVAGTYSSIFLAAPLLVQLEQWQKKEA